MNNKIQDKFIVLKREDVDKLCPLDKNNLERVCYATKVVRLKAYKPDRKYIVISDKEPELFQKVWELIEEHEKGK